MRNTVVMKKDTKPKNREWWTVIIRVGLCLNIVKLPVPSVNYSAASDVAEVEEEK